MNALERLFEWRGPVEAMDLIEVDPVGAQPAQTLLDLQHDVAARDTPIEHTARTRHEHLGCDHRLLAPSLECLADDLFRLPHAVAVGGVDEVDALVERAADDADAVVMVGIAPAAERHGAEAEAGNLEAAAAEASVLHG